MLGSIPSSRCQTTRRRSDRNPRRRRRCLCGRAKVPAGGARRDRTDDLLLAKQALSQLSYGPGPDARLLSSVRKLRTRENVVGLGRLELPTSRLSSARSNQLSYKPLIVTNGRHAQKPQGLRHDDGAGSSAERKRSVDGGVPPVGPDRAGDCPKRSDKSERMLTSEGSSLERR
jgi:hypothetical protein